MTLTLSRANTARREGLELLSDLYSNRLNSRIVVSGGRTGTGYSGYTGRYGSHGAVMVNGILGLPAAYRGNSWDAIGPEDGYRYSPWYRALNLISNAGALSTFYVKKCKRNGGYVEKEVDRAHPSHFPLRVRANREQTTARWLAQMLWNAVENGVSHAAIIDSKVSGRRELIAFPPGSCWKERVNGDLCFKLDLYGDRDEGKIQTLKPEDVFELTAPQPNGMDSVAPWWVARAAIYEGVEASKVRSARSKNNGKPRLALTTDQLLHDKTLSRLREDTAAATRGDDEQMAPLILDQNLKPLPIQFQADQASEINLARLPVSDVSNFTGVPVSLLGDFDAGSYNSLEADIKKFYEFCLSPWLDTIADEARAKMLSLEELINESHTIEVEEDLFRGVDAKGRVEIGRILSGGMPTAHVNEFRSRVLRWGPLGDQVANELVVPKNMGEDGSDNVPKNGENQGRPKKPTKDKRSAREDLARTNFTESIERVCTRIAGQATRKAQNASAFVDFAFSFRGQQLPKITDELRTPFNLAHDDGDVAEYADWLLAEYEREFQAITDRVTKQSQLKIEVEKSCKVLLRAIKKKISQE